MAAIDINIVKNVVDFFCKRNSRARNSSSDFGIAFNFANRQLFMERFGNPNQYQPGRPVPRIAYEQTEKISDDLRPFKVDALTINKFSNKFTYPTDLSHVISVDVTGALESATRYNENEIRTILNSKIVAPSVEYPAFVTYNGYIEVYPATVNKIDTSYLKKPKDVKWAYTIVNGREVYDPVNSIQPEWEEEVFNELVVRVLSSYGISMKDSEMYQIAEAKEVKGV